MKKIMSFLYIVGISIVLSACGETAAVNDSIEPPIEVTSNVVPDVRELNTKQNMEPRITKAVYDKIQYGMTYEQVVEIAGPGERVSGSNYKTDGVYLYKGESEEAGANAVLTFTDNKLKNKVQIGLQ